MNHRFFALAYFLGLLPPEYSTTGALYTKPALTKKKDKIPFHSCRVVNLRRRPVS